MTLSIHPAVDGGVIPGDPAFAGGTLSCQCATAPVAVSIAGNVAYSHVCGCTHCWRPLGALFSLLAVVPRGKISVTANAHKLAVVDPGADIQRHACTVCGVHMYARSEDKSHPFFAIQFVHPELFTQAGWAAPRYAAFVSSLMESGFPPARMEEVRERLSQLGLNEPVPSPLMELYDPAAADQKEVPAAPSVPAQPAARFEVRLPDGPLRQVADVAEVRDEIIAGTLPGDTPCRSVARPGKDGKVQEVAWSTVADTIGRSGFGGRVLFRPVWAHSLAGLQIGAALGFTVWMLLNIFGGLISALELSRPDLNDRAHFVAAKLAAYAIVCTFWLLNAAVPMLALTLPVAPLKRLAAAASQRGIQVAVYGLAAVAIFGRNLGGVFAGILPGMSAAFGAMVAGMLVLAPPGAVIGTVTGLIRASGLPTAARRQREPLWLPLLAGILLPVAISGTVAVVWLRFGGRVADAAVQAFIR
jgi:S-(hydroxymethyl)glutathione synthase